MAITIQDSVQRLVSDLKDVVSDGQNYVDRLQEKMDELETAKDTLQTCIGEAEEALSALENLSAKNLDDAMDEAESLSGY